MNSEVLNKRLDKVWIENSFITSDGLHPVYYKLSDVSAYGTDLGLC